MMRFEVSSRYSRGVESIDLDGTCMLWICASPNTERLLFAVSDQSGLPTAIFILAATLRSTKRQQRSIETHPYSATMTTRKRNEFLDIGSSDDEGSDRGYDSEELHETKGSRVRAVKRRRLSEDELEEGSEDDGQEIQQRPQRQDEEA
jgi:hypothetical protein